MWSKTALTRRGTWVCLLGSVLALVAFFLPYYGPPPGSLWDMLRLYWSEPDAPSALPMLSLFLGLLLVLLVSVVVLQFLAVFLRPLRENLPGCYQSLTILALSYYIAVALFALFFYWLGAELVDDPNVYPHLNTGFWLLPLGLLLTLLGSILLRPPTQRQGPVQTAESLQRR